MEIISKSSSLKEYDFNQGEVILLFKPEGWTSFDVVKKLRRVLHTKKIGHAGTLDPFATGLLVICTGRATKKVKNFVELDKTYQGTIAFGKITDTFDRTGKVLMENKDFRISREHIEAGVKKFIGETEQVPPMFSARKVGGIRLYHLARKGEEIYRESRKIKISKFEISRFRFAADEMDGRIDGIEFVVECSKGTYIRTLANDLGQELGCGAYLQKLNRSQIGPYRSSDAWTVEELEKFLGKN